MQEVLGQLRFILRTLFRNPFYAFVNLTAISVTLAVLMVSSTLIDQNIGSRGADKNGNLYLGIYQVKSTINLPEEPPETKVPDPNVRILKFLTNNLRNAQMVSINANTVKEPIFGPGYETSLDLKEVDYNFWQIMTHDFIKGRPISKDEVTFNSPVAVITQQVEDLIFAGDGLDAEIDIRGRSHRVVGIVDNVPDTQKNAYAQVWVPLYYDPKIQPSLQYELGGGDYFALILPINEDMKQAVREEVRANASTYRPLNSYKVGKVEVMLESKLDVLGHQMFSELGENAGDVFLYSLFGFYFAFMLIPSLNLTNLNVSRMMERQEEIGVRKAFGASKVDIVKQFLFENLVLVTLGGIIGVALSFVSLDLMNSYGLLSFASLELSWTWFSICIGVILAFSALSGIIPAIRIANLDAIKALKGGLE